MYVHAEQTDRNQSVKNGDLTIFIRVGSDLTLNYYEYEIPLAFTAWGTSATNPGGIWPDANSFNIDLAQLVQAKENRNVAMRATGSNITMSTPYVENDGKNRITVVGSPSISDVESIMIGIRNPKKTSQSADDDGCRVCPVVGSRGRLRNQRRDFEGNGGVFAAFGTSHPSSNSIRSSSVTIPARNIAT